LSFAENETYQAKDMNESAPSTIQVQPQSLSKTTPPSSAANLTKEQSTAAQQQPSATLTSTSEDLKNPNIKTAKQGDFDPVPDEHVNSIAKRIKIAYKILVNHNRAYDYKIHTTKQLQSILDQLNQAHASRGK